MLATNFLPSQVNPGGLTALIENLGRDCHPTQFLREFTKNAIEACQRTSDPKSRITIDFNSSLHEQHAIHKISFIDTGDGMDSEQMIRLLHNLSVSGDTKNTHKNYGVGAKISAMTRNHAGIQYESWKNGIGHAIFIKFDEKQGAYGLQGVPGSDGTSHYAIPLSEKDKPSEIADHGTRVTLWGMTDQQDTMVPPEGISGIRESWLALYLNSRFFNLPPKIEVSARIGYYRENNPRHNYLLSIKGQKEILDAKSMFKGATRLSEASIYWWVMPKGVDGHGRELLKGHTALINEDEIFDISDSRSNRVVYFGVMLGRDRVIIYVEPENVIQNTARTNLVRPDGSPVIWDKWQDEFRSNMPSELRNFLDQLQTESANESHTESIRERLNSIKELFKISRYRADLQGSLYADPSSQSSYPAGTERTGSKKLNPSPPQTTKPGAVTGKLSSALLTSLVEQSLGVTASSSQPNPFPIVKWVSASQNEQLTDRAAEFIQTENVILANSDFQGFLDLVKYFVKSYNDVAELIPIIEDEVKQAFEQILTECVAGALSLKNRQHWNPKDFEVAISKEALTTAVMQRYWMVSYIKRVLGNKIKNFNAQ